MRRGFMTWLKPTRTHPNHHNGFDFIGPQKPTTFLMSYPTHSTNLSIECPPTSKPSTTTTGKVRHKIPFSPTWTHISVPLPRNYHKASRIPLKEECDTACRKRILCRIVTPYYSEQKECIQIQSEVDGVILPRQIFQNKTRVTGGSQRFHWKAYMSLSSKKTTTRVHCSGLWRLFFNAISNQIFCNQHKYCSFELLFPFHYKLIMSHLHVYVYVPDLGSSLWFVNFEPSSLVSVRCLVLEGGRKEVVLVIGTSSSVGSLSCWSRRWLAGGFQWLVWFSFGMNMNWRTHSFVLCFSGLSNNKNWQVQGLNVTWRQSDKLIYKLQESLPCSRLRAYLDWLMS